jgi:hypothetical protein
LEDNQESPSLKGKIPPKVYRTRVIMEVTDDRGELVKKRSIDLGKMNENTLNELNDLFSLMSKDIDQIKKLEPQFEKLAKRDPEYLS